LSTLNSALLVRCGIRGQNDSTYEPAAILRRDEAAPTSAYF